MLSLQAPPDPLDLVHSLEKFLTENPRAALLDDGRVLFDMLASRYSLSAEHGRCVLHLWSEERNLIRTVVGLEERKGSLRILVRRLGTARPQSLQLAADRDQRTPGSRAQARKTYLRLLERVLIRSLSDYKIHNLHSAMDLEHSFGPAYTRGLLVRGQRSWAVIGAGAGETQATIDGVLTLGILWLAYCREHSGSHSVCQGLKVFVPPGSAAATRARMSWLNRNLGEWELYELCETSEELTRVDTTGEGNLEMRLTHAFDPQAAMERAQHGIERLMNLLPESMKNRVELRTKSANEVAFALHGLEFARVRQGFAPNSFTRQDSITFGAGLSEILLEVRTEPRFRELAERLSAGRHPAGSTRDPLFRLQPEGWLEAVLRRNLGELEPSLRSSVIYSQVPAFAAADRGILDLLTVTPGGRLAVLELKAGEDLHLPLQGLDYWIRVRWLNEQRAAGGVQSELERFGYFPGTALSSEAPLLYYVAPALHIHPSMEMVLAHFSPAIPWTLIAINEGWRTAPQVVFRKR